VKDLVFINRGSVDPFNPGFITLVIIHPHKFVMALYNLTVNGTNLQVEVEIVLMYVPPEPLGRLLTM
jgi:hypothetical protein